MARILSVVWYKILPARFGGQKGIAEFNQFLSQHHELACICSSNNEPTGAETYKVLPVLPVSKKQVFSFFAWRKIIRAAKQFNATHVIIEHPYYGLAGIFLKKKLGISLIIHSHNIESQRFKELGRWWWPVLSWLERTTHQHGDLNLFKSKEDYQYALAHFALKESQCLVLPFGITRNSIPSLYEKQVAKSKILEKHKLQPAEKILLFNGTLDYAPNAQAVEIIVQTLIPILEKKKVGPFKIIVCGRLFDPAFKHIRNLAHEQYIYAGYVKDISEYFLAADLLINPILEGGGIKVKVMQALSYNLSVISTASGAQGIDTRFCGKKLMIVDDNDWETFCNKIEIGFNEVTDIPPQFFEEYHWSNLIKIVAEKIDHL